VAEEETKEVSDEIHELELLQEKRTKGTLGRQELQRLADLEQAAEDRYAQLREQREDLRQRERVLAAELAELQHHEEHELGVLREKRAQGRLSADELRRLLLLERRADERVFEQRELLEELRSRERELLQAQHEQQRKEAAELEALRAKQERGKLSSEQQRRLLALEARSQL
jgi:hypothetical protein